MSLRKRVKLKMKPELMKTSNNDDLQRKWKTCIQMTCVEYRVKQMKELWDRVREAMRHFVERVKNAFKGLLEDLSELKSAIQERGYQKRKSYQRSYPHIVDKLNINTKGFPQPILRCARSRC